MGLVVVLSAFLALVGAVSEAGFESKAFDSADNPPTFQSMIVDCLTSNIPVTCLSIKAIMALNRAAQTDKKFEILPGVSIRRYEFWISAFSFIYWESIFYWGVHFTAPCGQLKNVYGKIDVLELNENSFFAHQLLKWAKQNILFQF